VRRIPQNLLLIIAALGGIVSSACQSGGVGDPCIPEDEYRAHFSGYSSTEVNVESRSFQCETRVCLVANFSGRVSCPYGQGNDPKVPLSQIASDDRCYRPGTSATPVPQGSDTTCAPGDMGCNNGCTNCVTVPVVPQKKVRPPKTAVYCSCRCNGPDKNVRYCECPSGYSCSNLITDYGFGSGQLAGSYCIKDGTAPPQNLDSLDNCLPPAAPAPAGCGLNKHPTGY